MSIRTIAAVPFAVSLVLAQAQPLELQPDPQHPVADAIVGSWQLDPELGKRLGRAKAPKEVTFRADAAVLARLPSGAGGPLAGRRIYAVGVVRVAARESLWALIEQAGAPAVVLFRERGAATAEEDERLTVMLVRGAAPAADLLFVNGEPGSQPFAAYSRVLPPGALEPVAALTEMARLLEAGNHVEFLREWVLPADLAKMQKGGRTLEACAAEFGEQKAKAALDALLAAAKLAPALDDEAGEAVFTGDGLARPLRLQRVGRRWYLRNP